jgi:hypothetical protein
MPGYIEAALHKYQHFKPIQPQHSPHKHNAIKYGVRQQLPTPEDRTDPASEPQKKRIQQITGTLLFYARAVDPTLLMPSSIIATATTIATQHTIHATNQILDYCATHPDAAITYRASDMILKIHSDASYLAEPKASSRGGGHYYLGNKPSSTPEPEQGPLLNRSNVIHNVMGSAAEAEVGALYDNLREAVPLRNTLQEMGHPQPQTPVQVDNSTANGFANNQIKQQKSKAIQMRFYWIQDRVKQKQFHVYWRPGSTNLADYFTKHVEEKYTIECPTLMLWLLMIQACGVKYFVLSHIRTHSNDRKPLTIVQDKQKETYTVDLVLVVEEKHNIECPTLMLWLLMRQACGVKSFVITYQTPQQQPQASDHCPRQTKGNIYGGFSPGS